MPHIIQVALENPELASMTIKSAWLSYNSRESVAESLGATAEELTLAEEIIRDFHEKLEEIRSDRRRGRERREQMH